MAYYGGSTTERPVSRVEPLRIFIAFLLVVMLVSTGYLLLNPSALKMFVQEKVVVKEVVVVPPSANEVLVAKQTIWPGQKLEPTQFKKEARAMLGMEAKAIRGFDQLNNGFATAVIPVDTPILLEHISAIPPANALTARIPAGHRAVTISVNAESGVEGWVRPGASVDVVWTTEQRSRRLVTTLVENAKVLSAERSMQPVNAQGVAAQPVPNHVTLLVSIKDASKIQLAKSSGTLSLVLRGDTDSETVGNETVTVDKMLKGKVAETEEYGQGTVIIDGKKFFARNGKLLSQEELDAASAQ